MSQLTRLREDHPKLARIFRQLGEVVAQAQPAFPDRAVRTAPRAHFNSARPPEAGGLGALSAADRQRQRGAFDRRQGLQGGMGGHARVFVAYCDRWAATSINNDWPGLCRYAQHPRGADAATEAGETRTVSPFETAGPGCLTHLDFRMHAECRVEWARAMNPVFARIWDERNGFRLAAIDVDLAARCAAGDHS